MNLRAAIASHIQHFVGAWQWSKGKRLAFLAGGMSGCEAIVTSGIPLPYSDRIPVLARLAVIGAIVCLAFYLRWRANRDNKTGAQ